jgi:hypothetical protein
VASLPEFFTGDTRKALRVTIKSAGIVVNLTGGSVRLFAKGVDSNDKPTSNPGESTWNGVLGVIVDGPNGVVDFQGLGSMLTLGTGRSGDRYRCHVRFTDATAKVSVSPQFVIIGRRGPI